jgi:hypothetical protein
MEGFAAALERVTQILVVAFGAAPLAWALLLLLLLVTLAVLAWRRRSPPNEVETLYLASAAAIRKAREIGEIEAVARRMGSIADEVKEQVARLRRGHHSRVKVYVDHSNFITTWNNEVHGRDRPLEHDVDWQILPQVLLEETGDWLTRARRAPQALLYRGMNVYGTLFEEDYFKLLETMLGYESTAPNKLPLPIRLRKDTIDRWREENERYKLALTRDIRNVAGSVMVPIYRRTPREDQLGGCQYTSGGIPIAPEKMLDTHITTDLIGDATFDTYDIAILVSEDSDFVPAVAFVQDMRNKQVVHVGFGSRTTELRSACRHRIDLARDKLFRRLQRQT